jgi:hypothetical protein
MTALLQFTQHCFPEAWEMFGRELGIGPLLDCTFVQAV